MRWLATGLEARRLWPVGYLNLEENLTLARTDAPVANRRLALHIATTDEGPVRRWWLDTLAAEWMILPAGEALPVATEEVASRGGMRLIRNHAALAVLSLADHPPAPDRPGGGGGDVTAQTLGGNSCSARIIAPSTAWLWVSLAPVKGWQWRLDGRPVELAQGPGIVQYLEVSAGNHRFEGRYRPPMFLGTTFVSLGAVLALLFGLARSNSESNGRFLGKP
jgi:hypothetical protein